MALAGIQTVTRRTGTAIVLYNVTLPQALPYDYVPIA